MNNKQYVKIVNQKISKAKKLLEEAEQIKRRFFREKANSQAVYGEWWDDATVY